MPVENTTPNRGYQKPFGSNNLEDDVLRLIAALDAIDVDVAGLLVSVTQRALLVHSHVISETTGLQAALDAKQDESEKGNANGYASLGPDGKVPAAQLPSALFGSLNYQGDWNANTNTPTIPAAAAGNKGWYYMVSVAGATSVGGITDWKVGDWAVSDGTKWVKIDNTDAVASVAGKSGAVTLQVADITDMSANGRSLAQAANYAAMKTLLAITAADITNASANGRSLITAADYAAMRTLLGLVAAATAATASTLAQRDASGDITTRLFRSEYAAPGATGYFCGQNALGAGADNYIRPMTPAQAAALLTPSMQLQRFYESAPQTWTNGGTLTLAHGLGVRPNIYHAYATCISADGGYSAGEEILLAAWASDAADGRGVSLRPDATNIKVVMGANGLVMLSATGGYSYKSNPSSTWKLIIRAWA
ncbi:MAG: hypothetical protein E5V95_13640 [Mesorhizobium sp.]|uniref:hypothetical protein n=1 Tax=Mesorhizobium sp. TaxID=1871066 RepID=UPI000FE6981F|nr:hypothetical protein [Mesorhizobium sp.]RWA87918.1 MAG: hypothetical protein EOQ31_23190 [Mesorhizobium sp.]RWF23470.1 MAG: hypothetical protein EOS44_27595 [Mesorhizobium sp.]TIV18387.1 MAG: hypothetical protein E5V95_13640 [Mesorhizobium sp.]